MKRVGRTAVHDLRGYVGEGGELDADNPKLARTFRRLGDVIRGGGVVAFPTETVYGLGVDAFNDAALETLYGMKGRPRDNPLIVHIGGRGDVGLVASHVPEDAERLMDAFWPGPLTIILMKADALPPAATAGLPTVAVRQPSHGAAAALIKACGRPIAAPSANLSGKPSAVTAESVLEDFGGSVDAVIDCGDSPIGLESTVIDMSGPTYRICRYGAVTPEAIRALLPGMGRSETEAEGPPISPGMRHRHYAPEARVQAIYGDRPSCLAAALDMAAGMCGAGRKVGFLCGGEHAGLLPRMVTKGMGAVRPTAWGEGYRLYESLREFDREGYDDIVTIIPGGAGGPGPGLAGLCGVSLALADRVARASDGRVTDVSGRAAAARLPGWVRGRLGPSGRRAPPNLPGAPVPPGPSAPSILFVCSGNTCRSPMAEAIFKDLLTSSFPVLSRAVGSVGSAGTSAAPGQKVAEYAERAMLDLYGADVGSKRSESLASGMAEDAAVILAMDRGHLRRLEAMGRGGVSMLLGASMAGGEGGEGRGLDGEVRDPYGGDLSEYYECALRIHKFALFFLLSLENAIEGGLE